MFAVRRLLILALVFISSQVFAVPHRGRFFDHAIFVIFENTNYSAALHQPFFGKLAKTGALFSNFMAITHPSQGNYIALTSGSLNGVKGDSNYDVNAKNIVDLLEARGITWRVYVEDYPGKCFTGAKSQHYARKHNPFISYVNIQKDSKRCANIVNADSFEKDAASGNLPEYVFYVPNVINDGHDTGVAYADKWYSKKFGPYVANNSFMENTVLISTFDESGPSMKNQIYTSVVGAGVTPRVYAQGLNVYSLLALMEENWNLGDLGKFDVSAPGIPDIWK